MLSLYTTEFVQTYIYLYTVLCELEEQDDPGFKESFCVDVSFMFVWVSSCCCSDLLPLHMWFSKNWTSSVKHWFGDLQVKWRLRIQIHIWLNYTNNSSALIWFWMGILSNEVYHQH